MTSVSLAGLIYVLGCFDAVALPLSRHKDAVIPPTGKQLPSSPTTRSDLYRTASEPVLVTRSTSIG